MSRTNKPIWQDTIVSDTGVSLQHLVNGTWQDTGMRVMPVPAGYQPDAAINRFVEGDLKSTKPEFVGETAITVQPYAYQVYKTGDDEIGFINDWSYEEWTGDIKCLSAPINHHADSRQRLVYGNFSETGNTIEVKELIRPEITIEPRQIELNYDGRSAAITITSNVPYELSVDETWLYFTPQSGEPGTQVIYIGIDENKTFHDREAAIKMTYESYWQAGDETITACTIAQKAVVPSYVVYPMEQIVDWDFTGLTYFAVNTNVPFTASTDASWLSYSGMSQAGYHAYNVYFNTSANTGDARQTTVSFAFQVDDTGGTASVVADVFQGIKEYAMDIPSALTLSYLEYKNSSYNSGRKEFIITTDSPQWSVQCTEDWIRYVGYAAYSNNRYLLRFEVDENSGTTSRYADIIYTYIKNNVQETGTKSTHVEQVYEGSGKMFIYYTYSSDAAYNQGKRINEESFDASYAETQAIEIGRTGSGARIQYNCLVTAVFDEEITEISGKAMGNNNTTTGVSIPDTIVSVSSDAFNNLSGITNIWWNTEAVAPEFYDSDRISLYIGNSVQDIPDSGFTNIDRLYSVSFGTGVQTIGKGAFYNSFNAYSTSITIPDYVEEIGEYSFANNSKLSGIILGSGLETIPSYAFYGYNGPNSINKQVYFGTNITRICTGAFGDGSSSQYIGSTVIHFNGTFAQWQNITIETNWHNFAALWVKCTDGNYYVAPDGSYWQ